jgi:dienelactone hydrolase
MTRQQSGPPRRDRRYWLRLLRLAVFAVLLPVIVLPVLAGAVSMWALTHPGCGDDGRSPADYQLAYREISIPARAGGTYRGFFIPGTKDATIIVPPAYNGGRGGMLHEAALLAQDGYNVLLYESRACAGKPVISLGYNEVDDVGDVLAYLKQNGDNIRVNLSKLALHGFSSAGATSLMATARFPEIAAVLAEGGYHNADAQMGIDRPHSLLDVLILFGSRIAYRVGTGIDSAALSPLDAMRHIPPRPIFLVYGSREVSLNGAKEELAAAQSANPDPAKPPRLWIVPEATHGSYTYTVGVDEYKRWVLPFYACALFDQCAQWDALWTK